MTTVVLDDGRVVEIADDETELLNEKLQFEIKRLENTLADKAESYLTP